MISLDNAVHNPTRFTGDHDGNAVVIGIARRKREESRPRGVWGRLSCAAPCADERFADVRSAHVHVSHRDVLRRELAVLAGVVLAAVDRHGVGECRSYPDGHDVGIDQRDR